MESDSLFHIVTLHELIIYLRIYFVNEKNTDILALLLALYSCCAESFSSDVNPCFSIVFHCLATVPQPFNPLLLFSSSGSDSEVMNETSFVKKGSKSVGGALYSNCVV